MVTVTLPPDRIEPFQVTRLLAMSASAVPEVADALINVTDDGS